MPKRSTAKILISCHQSNTRKSWEIVLGDNRLQLDFGGKWIAVKLC
jgi:hypothetical protein